MKIANLFMAIMVLLSSSIALAEVKSNNGHTIISKRKVARIVKKDFKRKHTLEKRLEKTIKNITATAIHVLEKRGHDLEAVMVKASYENALTSKLLGDHEPMNEYLEILYDRLYTTLGETVMKMWHLDDIRILNYGLPVLLDKSIAKNLEDYLDHEIQVAGVVAYWTSFAVCSGIAAYGAVVIPFGCPAMGIAAELFVKQFVAPPLGEWIYCRDLSGELGCS